MRERKGCKRIKLSFPFKGKAGVGMGYTAIACGIVNTTQGRRTLRYPRFAPVLYRRLTHPHPGPPLEREGVGYFANSIAGFSKALNSMALPQGSRKNMVACSPG